jgi:hypothetical protein
MSDKLTPSTNKTNTSTDGSVVGDQLNSDNSYSENGLENAEELNETMNKTTQK